MKMLAKLWEKTLDILEIHIPTVLFCFLFLFYLILIIYRYITKGQLQSLNELTTIIYMWCTVMAFAYGTRTHSDVSFSLLYDKCPPKVQRGIDLVNHLFLFATFVVLLVASVEFVSFMEVKKSSILKIPFSIVYAPFLVFVALTLYHTATDLCHDIARIVGKEDPGKGGEDL